MRHRQVLTRGQQRPRKRRRGRNQGTSWVSLGLIAAAVIGGWIAWHAIPDETILNVVRRMTEADMLKLMLIVVALVAVWSFRKELKRLWGVIRARLQQ